MIKKNIDLNYISYCGCDNLFINNIPIESKTIEKHINKDYQNKNK